MEDFDSNTKLHPYILAFLKFVSEGPLSIVLWIAFGLAVFTFIVTAPWIVRRFYQPPREDWEWLRFFVSRARERAYKELSEAMPHHHRVTLYKYVDVLPVEYRHWSAKTTDVTGSFFAKYRANKKNKSNRSGDYPVNKGWLIPVIRAGYDDIDCSKSTVFVAARDNSLFEGVAGKSWGLKSTVVIKELPEVTSSNNNNRRIYADKSECDRGLVDFMLADTSSQSHKVLPRTIGSIVLVDQKGDNWGVLVFDSRDEDAFPTGVNSGVELNDLFDTTIKGMTKALKGRPE